MLMMLSILSKKCFPTKSTSNNVKKKFFVRCRFGPFSQHSPHMVTFIKSYQQDYRFVSYSDWTIMLKYLANPEHYCTTKDYYNNIATNFVKTSEYAQYICKKEGKLYPCNSLEINMFKSCYISTFDRDLTIIDFSDFNNNGEHVQRIFQTIDSLLK